MFCKKCGKKINDDAKFCNYCGDTILNVNAPKTNNSILDKVMNFFAPLGKAKVWFISTSILLLLNPIFAAAPNIEVSENVTGSNIYSQTFSIFSVLSDLADDISFIGVLMGIGIISIIIAEFMMIYPLIKRTTCKPKNVLITIFISIIALLFIAFIYIGTFADAAKNELVNCSLTFCGFLLVIDSIALVITSFNLFQSLRKIKGGIG